MNSPAFLHKSAVSNIHWPAVPYPAGATLMALQYQLEESQWWDRGTLLEHQLTQLRYLLSHVRETVPYYRDRLRNLDLDTREKLKVEEFTSLPLLSREDLQSAGTELRSTRLPPHHGSTRVKGTSGATGRPVEVVTTEVTGMFWLAFTLRDHLWHRRNLAGKLAALRHAERGTAMPPEGHQATGWGPATDHIYVTGPAVLLNIQAPVEEQVEWLRAQDPDYLLTYPSNLAALARRFKEKGYRLSKLREVRTVSEVVGSSIRQLCREVWGVPMVDVYTTQEAGYLALQCPEHEHYHVQAENVLLEVLDGDNRPCGPGETGRVVVTSLHNFAMPLIRYELGDYAEVGASCPCGRGLPVLSRILGRVRNMLTLPNGEQRWPLFGDYAYSGIAPVRQYQFIQHSLHDIEARLVVDRPLGESEERELREWILMRLGYPFELRFSYPGHIPRSKSGKFEDFRSEIVTC